MTTKKLAALCLAATGLAATGCGGSSKSGTTTTTAASSTPAASTPAQTTATTPEIKVQTGHPLSQKVWIARADAICRGTQAKLAATKAKTQADVARLLPQVAAYEREEATELSKLSPPASQAVNWQRIVTGLQKYGELSIKAGEATAAKTINGAVPYILAARTISRELTPIIKHNGFRSCSIEA